MPRKPASDGRSRTAKGRSRRRQILTTATRLFSERGYVHTSLMDIADQLGITGPAIYYYYASKDHILLEIRQGIIDRAIERIEEVLADEPPPQEAMETILRLHLETLLDNVEATIVVDRERGHLPEEIERAQRAKERQYERYIRDVYVDGVAAGVFDDVDPTVAVGTLLAGCNWACHLGGNRAKSTVVESIVGLLMRAIVVPA